MVFSFAKQIKLSTPGTIHIYNIDDIIRCESFGNYTRFYFYRDNPLLIAKTLKEFEKTLCSQYQFARIHNSHIINLNHLKKYLKTEEKVIMSDGLSVPVSQRKKSCFLELLKENLH